MIDKSIDRRGLYLELRSSNNKMIYAFPRIVIDPDELLVVLKTEGLDVLVLTSRGQRGWTTARTLEVVSKFSVVSAESE